MDVQEQMKKKNHGKMKVLKDEWKLNNLEEIRKRMSGPARNF